MSGCANKKRPHQLYKTPFSVLQYFQLQMTSQDHSDLEGCVIEYTNFQNTIALGLTRKPSEAFLYTRCCGLIFKELQEATYAHFEFMSAIMQLADVSQAIRAGICVVSKMQEKENTLEAETENTLEAETDCTHKDLVDEGKITFETLSEHIKSINAMCEEKLNREKTSIAEINSHIRFCRGYNSLERILHLARGCNDGVIECCHKTVNSLLDQDILASNAYETIKNQCLLGAVIKHTNETKRKTLQEREQTRISGQKIDTVVKIKKLTTAIVARICEVYKKTILKRTMLTKMQLVLTTNGNENEHLKTELETVQEKVEVVRKFIMATE